jgi:uncharacterized protein YndB with AHSA1/START domain
MARNETFVAAPPEAVFELLADPRTYGYWVVGSHEIRAADKGWPADGAAFHHTVGKPPLRLKDETVVVHAREPVMIELRAKARPLPTARVTLHLQPEGDGTRVTIVEDPANPLLNLLAGPFGHLAIRLRNRESLRRLKALAEGTAPRPRGRLPRSDGAAV